MSYRKLSNAINITSDTGNVEALLAIADDIDTACVTGKISIVDAAALRGELDAAVDHHYRHEADRLDQGFYAIEKGL